MNNEYFCKFVSETFDKGVYERKRISKVINTYCLNMKSVEFVYEHVVGIPST